MPTGEREVVLRLATINPGPAVKALEAKGYVVRDAGRGAPAAPWWSTCRAGIATQGRS
jgi:hypothetical protein